MRLSPPSLLVAVVLSSIAACTLDTSGLGPHDAGRAAVVLPDGGTAGHGAAGTGSGGGGAAGSAGDLGGGAGSVGVAGSSGTAGAAGSAGAGSAGAGGAGTGGATGGAGATGSAGAGGATGSAGAGGVTGSAGATGGGPGGSTETPDGGGAAGAGGTFDAHPISRFGCADGTREGFTVLTTYPDVAACAGGWQVPGFLGPGTMSPACGRNAGNDGDRPNGEGCSVADLCAEGWHVCEGSVEFSTKASDCRDALPTAGDGPAFYGTRQRGPDKTCDPTNQTGTNNIYGCGNFGSPALAACAPFTRMLRDADCKANSPWMCVNGPIDYNVTELLDVTKPGPARGGVLCCR